MPFTTVTEELFQLLNQTAGSRQGPYDTQTRRDSNENAATILLDVTSITGTAPTLDVDVECDVNGITYVVKSFAQINATGKYQLEIPMCPDSIYIDLIEGGTWTDLDVNCAIIRG